MGFYPHLNTVFLLLCPIKLLLVSGRKRDITLHFVNSEMYIPSSGMNKYTNRHSSHTHSCIFIQRIPLCKGLFLSLLIAERGRKTPFPPSDLSLHPHHSSPKEAIHLS